MSLADIVATWKVSLRNQIHSVEFEHGTTTGKRVIRVDGKEVLRREWMFKLVGKENFEINKMQCSIIIAAHGTLAYEYTLIVDGRTFEKFKEEQKKKMHSWETTIGGQEWRVVLDKESMNVWANGNNIDTAGEFVDGGSLIHFELVSNPCRIETQSSGNKKAGMTYTLFVNNNMVPYTTDEGKASSSTASSS